MEKANAFTTPMENTFIFVIFIFIYQLHFEQIFTNRIAHFGYVCARVLISCLCLCLCCDVVVSVCLQLHFYFIVLIGIPQFFFSNIFISFCLALCNRCETFSYTATTERSGKSSPNHREHIQGEKSLQCVRRIAIVRQFMNACRFIKNRISNIYITESERATMFFYFHPACIY